MGYPLFRLASDTGWVPASLLVAGLFAVAHLGNPGENPLGIVQVFQIGVIFATTIRLTGNLWLSVGIHAGAVLAEDFLFSVPDSGVVYTGHLLISRLTGPAWLSGGDAGPEGSVLALPVFAVMFALLWIVYRRPARP
jgi:membrane protease YdiL (CAAX protease family)